ncbi:hypothetical protein HQ38_06725 [Porphyromonas crevioricanis]|uniref:Uncharacterized protein n=1 Tax=Porphyromonas crevioricanis TaxID=393921 RepID=A0AB34PG03_9PORP|nr:hypothetical protein HQ38_06725 [Porphyromonas crevioricanis]
MAKICKIKHYCYLGSRYNRQEFSEKPSSGERGGGGFARLDFIMTPKRSLRLPFARRAKRGELCV